MRIIKCFVILFILSQQVAFSQRLNLNPKSSLNFGSDFSSHQLSIEGLYQFPSKLFEFGGIIGLVNMNYNDHKWEKAINGAYKLFYGIRTNYYPFNSHHISFYPYIGLKYASVYDNSLAVGGGMMVFSTGYYFPNAKDDLMASIIIGVKLNIRVIFEIEYEFRKFDYVFDEYYYDEKSNLLSRRYQSNRKTNTIQISFGYNIKL